jgi:FtsZ-interacting cell division protein ZipA
MPELRWTLLILGALFVGALALWELRRQKHASPNADKGAARGVRDTEWERISPTMDGTDAGHDTPARGVFREPTLTLPDVQLDANGDLRDRAPIADPRVVELDDESIAGLRVDGQQVVDEFSSPERDEEPLGVVEPMIPRLSAAEMSQPAGQPAAGFDEHDAPTAQYDVSAREPEPEPAAAIASAAFGGTAPIVDWPHEDSRKIIALRLVSGAGERFAGRAVRLALAAEGFLMGKFEIFHKPGPDSRAVLSAASLTKPGTFSPATMDAQRFGGLSLFAVLPGPLSPLATFDELLVTARSLNDRLRGALQDERGEPLTPMRSASIRESLSAAASAAAPVVSAARPAAATQATHGPGGAGSV